MRGVMLLGFRETDDDLLNVAIQLELENGVQIECDVIEKLLQNTDKAATGSNSSKTQRRSYPIFVFRFFLWVLSSSFILTSSSFLRARKLNFTGVPSRSNVARN